MTGPVNKQQGEITKRTNHPKEAHPFLTGKKHPEKLIDNIKTRGSSYVQCAKTLGEGKIIVFFALLCFKYHNKHPRRRKAHKLINSQKQRDSAR
jgi:hypothetical protein